MKKKDVSKEKKSRLQASPKKNDREGLEEDESLALDDALARIAELQQTIKSKDEKLRYTRVQIEKARSKYNELYNSVPIGYCHFTKTGIILDANLAIARQLGLEKEKLLDSQFTEYVVEEYREQFLALLKTTYETRQQQTCDIKLLQRDGSEFFARLETDFVQDYEDSSTYCRTVVHDITGQKQAENALRRHNSELALLNRVSQAFNSTLDLDQILVTVLKEVRRLLEVVGCSIWLKDPETDELICQHAIGPYSGFVRGWHLAPGQGLAGTVAQTGKSLIVPDVWADERHFNGIDRQTGQTLRSILTVAMKVKGNVIGVIQVLDTEVNHFSLTDQALQELLATAASIAIENARLTERLQHETTLRTSLLQEVQQRNSQNFASFHSLLGGMQDYARQQDTQMSPAFAAELLNRVNALMAAQAMFADVAWAPLPLSEFCQRAIAASLKSLDAEARMLVNVMSAPLHIFPRQANVLALILYELTVNAVRHALADRESGHIIVQMERQDETLQLEFRDDGPGYPDRVLRFDQRQMGLSLVKQLVERELPGEFTRYNDHGAVMVLRFNVVEE